jgi:hypothetical protein
VNISVLYIIGNGVNQPVARHFNSGNHSVSDIKIRASVLFLVEMIATKNMHEMRLISKLGTAHPYGINERFSYV